MYFSIIKCCCINEIPSTPAGYADDLATATKSRTKTDRLHEIAYSYRRIWRFTFNASKSAVLIYGEKKKEHKINSLNRYFKLGPDIVQEKSSYDHVGVKNCIFDDDGQKVEEKVSQGRKTLNAATGLGIRKNGITMMSGNIIFWAVVAPTVTFGSELWVLSENDIENLLSFERFAGRHIQRLICYLVNKDTIQYNYKRINCNFLV